jgi:hypothetical protein
MLCLIILATAQVAQAYYDPAIQRWTNRDPIQEEGGLNFYSYVKNNPTLSIDAFGLVTQWNPGGPGGMPPEAAFTLCNYKACYDHLQRIFWTAHRTAENLVGTRHATAGSTADAMTHCIGACETARGPGPCGLADAKRQIDRREDFGESDLPEKEMDYLNNQVGYVLASKPGDCTLNCLTALNDGELWTIRKGQVVLFSRNRPPPFVLFPRKRGL